MIDRDLVTSGFDTETVVSEAYLSYLLLAQIEARFLPLEFPVVDPATGFNGTIILHPPAAENYQRLYVADPGAPLPEPVAGSFGIALMPGEKSPVASIAFSPDGSRLVAGSWDGLIRLWDVETRVDLRTFVGHGTSVTSVAFSADGTRVASASVDGTVRLWDVETGSELAAFHEHTGPVFGVAISPDGSRIASGGSDRVVRVRDSASGDALGDCSGHSLPVLSVAFSPDGTRIASGSLDQTVRVWDVTSGTEITALSGHTGPVASVAFDPGGTRIASGAFDRTVRVWNIASGTVVNTLTGHTEPVASVAYSPDGTRIASGSNDRTVRLWNADTGAEVRMLEGHVRPVLCVAFSPDGASIASSSEDRKIRLWQAATGNPLRGFTLVFMGVSIFTTVIDNGTGNEVGSLNAGLLVDFDIESQETDAGLERNHAIRIELVRLDEATVALLQLADIDPQTVEDQVRAQLDRTFPLGVAQGQQVQRIRIRKLIDGPRRSVGFYVDLALRSGPEPNAFHEPRGNVAFARDFREAGMPIAFATSPGLFALLGPDTKFRQAEETAPGSGNFRFPLREDPLDTDSNEIGRIKNVTIGPELFAPGNVPPVPTGRLKIDVHGEYTDALGDPDFHLQLFFKPEIESGLVDWDLDVDVDLGLLATLLLIAGGIGLTLLFAPGLAWGSTLFVGTILGLAVLKELIAEPLAAKIVEDRLDEDQQASFFDALPFRVPAALRRWDPFYTTAHQVVGLVDQVTVDQFGIAFEGTALRLGKQPSPVNHAVIRDEERSAAGAITALRYRIADFGNHQADFEAAAPGVDRMAFRRADPLNDPTLVSLTDAQIAERIGDEPDERRILAPITYTAERIHLVDNQIDQLLCLSRIERGEQRRLVIDAFRDAIEGEVRTDEGVDILDQVTEQLEQDLGRPSTPQETAEAFDKRIDERVQELFDERFPDFEENDLPDELDAAIAQVLRFDLAPEEMIERQRAGVVLLDGKEIIVRENADGTITPYYRDHPDGDPADNLLSLPHYSPPYAPPSDRYPQRGITPAKFDRPLP